MNISEYDNTIDNAQFKTKVDNIFVMLFTSIMQGDISRCKHKISDNIYTKYESIVNDLNAKNQRQMYDELNVSSTEIDDIKIEDGYIVVYVTLISKYMDYIVSKEDFTLISGDNNNRIMKTNKLVLKKKTDAEGLKSARRCPGCGAPADVSNTGICEYCGASFNTEKYDYILDSIETY